MNDQHSIYPPSVFVWDLSKPNIGKLIIHTMEAANDLYTRGDVYNYGPPTVSSISQQPINVEGLGLKARTNASVLVYAEPDRSKPFLRNGVAKVVSHATVDIFEIIPGWFRVFPPFTIKERAQWVRIENCV